MIKFFRRIRQQLLSQNKFSKYMLYAVGEIVLVVIGILIALSINNWNENRKLRNQEIINLNNIKEDINSQIQLLEIYLGFEDIIIDQTKDIVAHYELNKGFNNMDSIFPKLHDLVVTWPFSNTNTTLMQLLNSNQINTIQNRQLKEELIAYNQEINLFTKNTNTNNTNLIDNLTSLKFMKNGAFAVYGVSDRMLEKFNDMYSTEIIKVTDNKLKQISTQILNEPKTKLEVINMVVFRNALSNLQKSGNLGLKKRSEQILQLLKDEISLLDKELTND